MSVQARVVAATHRDLDAAAEVGDFRQDLLFRINVHVLRVPPLRDRLSDIPDLARHFAALLGQRLGRPRQTISAAALEALAAYDWRRNNVRELRNVIERMIIASHGDTLDADDVPADIRKGTSSRTAAPHDAGTYQQRKAEAERAIILQALDHNDWGITRTAEALGLADHASLLKIMRRLGIERDASA